MNEDYKTLGTHVHIWIGTTKKKEEEYYKYFELDYTHDLDDTNYIVCEFCKDIGEKWYDEDFIFYPEPLAKQVDIIELLDDSIVLDKNAVIEKCHKLALKKANAIFGYATPESHYKNDCLNISIPYKNYYNGLKYIGKFIHS